MHNLTIDWLCSSQIVQLSRGSVFFRILCLIMGLINCGFFKGEVVEILNFVKKYVINKVVELSSLIKNFLN